MVFAGPSPITIAIIQDYILHSHSISLVFFQGFSRFGGLGGGGGAAEIVDRLRTKSGVVRRPPPAPHTHPLAVSQYLLQPARIPSCLYIQTSQRTYSTKQGHLHTLPFHIFFYTYKFSFAQGELFILQAGYHSETALSTALLGLMVCYHY